MKSLIRYTGHVVTAALLAGPLCLAASPQATTAQGKTAEIVRAADDFLASLTPEQRKTVTFAFDDKAQRVRWSNFPTGFVPRAGMSLKVMSAPQQEAALKLMSEVLSPMGMEKVNQIRQADDDFKTNGSKRRQGGQGGGRGPGGPGGPPPGQNGPPRGPGGLPPGQRGPGGPGGGPPSGDMFGADLYYISFLGTPSATRPWMLQFGGHHLALNITIAGSRGVLTPTLTGAQPALFKLNGQTVRPLGRESDGALALLKSLNEEQRKQAVLGYTVADLVLGPGQDGKKIMPEGLKASAMTAKQKALLLDVVGEWANILNSSSATVTLQQIRSEIDQTWFAWSGSQATDAGQNITAYYRVQGPHLVIEYAPQSDEPDNHVHTMYRDPTNDYGQAMAQP